MTTVEYRSIKLDKSLIDITSAVEAKYTNSTRTTIPARFSDEDLADGETPFDSTSGTDAFGVSYGGAIYDCMEPANVIITVDYGVLD